MSTTLSSAQVTRIKDWASKYLEIERIQINTNVFLAFLGSLINRRAPKAEIIKSISNMIGESPSRKLHPTVLQEDWR